MRWLFFKNDFYLYLIMTAKQKRVLTIFIHVICWLVFLSLPAIFSPRRDSLSLAGVFEDLMEPARRYNALLLIAVFYFNYYLAIPKFYLQHRYPEWIISILGAFLLFCILNYALLPAEVAVAPDMNDIAEHSGQVPQIRNARPHMLSGINLFMFIIVDASSFTLFLYEQLQQTKKQMINTQISFLKAQINPHFLFNTLNSIYSLTLTKSDRAPDVVVKLSGMMRYAVSEANQSFVALSKELSYISNYIELQRLRLSDKVKIRYEITGTGQAEDKRIAPFLLIPFVENAFKYGVNSSDDSDILIQIYLHENDLHLYAYNFKVYIRPDIDKGTSLGIKTTRQRLNLLYPGKHIITVRDGDKDFAVSLNITF